MANKQTTPNPPIKGHALAGQGAPHDAQGHRIPGKSWYGSVAGPGHAKCQCGAISPHLSGPSKRRDWHREHKSALRGTVVPPRTWMAMPAMQNLTGQHWVLVSGTWDDIHLSPLFTEEQAHALAHRLNGDNA